MTQTVRRIFDVKPEYLKSQFLDHIRKNLPHTCDFITHEKPPREGIDVLLQDFVIPRHIVARDGKAPCPICSPNKPKYVKGHLLWSSQSKAMYAVGHCCGHGFFSDGSLARALRTNENAERRRNAENLIEANWKLPSELIAHWATLRPTARDLDKVVNAVRRDLGVGLCREIYRSTRDGGYLKVQQKVGEPDSHPSKGLKAVELPFGSSPVRGASIMRSGSRGQISFEARLSNLMAALSQIHWETEDDAILWLCEQVDAELLRLCDFLEEAIEGIQELRADVQALHQFLAAENLNLVNSWVREVQRGKSTTSIRNEGGHISIQRGGRRHRNFWLPDSLLNVPDYAPTLRRPHTGGSA